MGSGSVPDVETSTTRSPTASLQLTAKSTVIDPPSGTVGVRGFVLSMEQLVATVEASSSTVCSVLAIPE